MDILKSSLVSLYGNKIRTIMWMVIFSIVIVIVMSLFSINTLYNSMITQMYQNNPIPVQVGAHMPTGFLSEKLYDWDNYQSVTDEMNQKISSLDSVSKVEKKMTSSIGFGDLKFKSSQGQVSSFSAVFIDDISELSEKEGYTINLPENSFTGNSVILSEEMLAQNDLQIGDSVNLDLNNAYEEKSFPELKSIEFKIAGSFQFEPTDKMMDKLREEATKYNYEPIYDTSFENKEIYMPKSIGESVVAFETDNNADPITVQTSYLFYLKSIDELPTFKQEVSDITGFDVDITIDQATLQNGTKIVNNISRLLIIFNPYFTIFAILVIALVALIGSVLLIKRKNEIGILLALGMSPKQLFLQLLLELALPMLLPLIVVFVVWQVVAIRVVNIAECGSSLLIVPLLSTLVCMSILILISLVAVINYFKFSNLKKIL